MTGWRASVLGSGSPTGIAGELPLRIVGAIGELDVRRSLTSATDVVLDVELHLLAFLDRVEDSARQRRVMEEDFRTVLTADEPESTISDHPHYCAPHETLPPSRTPSRRMNLRRKMRAIGASEQAR
jgi:hypothetical protein